MASDAANATLIAIAISSIIPGWRCWISAHAPDRNGPAAPEEDHRAEDRSDPVDAGEVELVAEPVHDHRARDDDRDGQQQAPPEPSPKHARMARMLRVARMAVACRAPSWVPGHASRRAARVARRSSVRPPSRRTTNVPSWLNRLICSGPRARRRSTASDPHG